MAGDIDSDLFLISHVRVIRYDEAGATLTDQRDREFRARQVIATVPLHALSRIEIPPPAVRAATGRGQLGLGTKVWFTIEGERPHFVALGGVNWPLNFFHPEYHHDGKTFVIGFSPDAHAIDPNDSAAVQEVLRRLVPDAIVIESTGHDWADDESAGETSPMHRTGYLTNSLPVLQQPHGPIHFAGSDIADGWGGFIDGAVESGMRAARAVLTTRRTLEPVG